MYIACPKCDWRPQGTELWVCECRHRWHTFNTHGVCPACGKAWRVTQCLACHEFSDHEEWYHEDDSPTVEEYITNPERVLVPVSGFTMSQTVPESVTRLVEAFSRLPGVGPKTASRLTYFLLRAPDDVSQSLAVAVGELKIKTRLCSVCFNITEDDPCPVCLDSNRDGSLIAVVEEPLDALAIERTGVYKGRYHVLHGVISPRDGIGPDQLKIKELAARVSKGGVSEVIISTNPGLEGDATAMYVQQELRPTGVHVTRLARGLPTGGDLEYVDSVTLTRALQGRHAL